MASQTQSPATNEIADHSLSAYGRARSTVHGDPLSPEELRKTDAYWRACTYVALGMIYLPENPLLREPLKLEHIKNRLLGHWGSSPGLAFCYIHLNRLIKKYDQNMIFMAGPGHGAPGVLGPVYLEGSYSEIYTDKSEDEQGMGAFLSNSRSRAASVVIARPRLPARSTKGANSDTFFRMLVVQPL